VENELTESFGTMLSPIRAGQHTLRNRVIMGSMHTRLETEPDGIAKQIAFYSERARGEAAILVTGGFPPMPRAYSIPKVRVLMTRKKRKACARSARRSRPKAA